MATVKKPTSKIMTKLGVNRLIRRISEKKTL